MNKTYSHTSVYYYDSNAKRHNAVTFNSNVK